MKHCVGLDVSQKEFSLCVVDGDGAVIAESKVATEPALVLSWIEGRVGAVERIVHESGPLSMWLTRELARLGAPVVCIDARAAHKALSARMNESDRADAEALAQLARTGWYREVHIKSETSDRLRLLLGARERMIRIRQDIEGRARVILKTHGIRLGPVAQSRERAGFREQLQAAASGDPLIEAVAASLIAEHDTACAEAAAIDDVKRFAKATEVDARGAGDPPGEIDYSGRISKRGDGAMRALFYEAASVLITRVQRFSPLKAWAVRLAAHKGFKKAAVAAARKIAIVMLRLWRDGTTLPDEYTLRLVYEGVHVAETITSALGQKRTSG